MWQMDTHIQTNICAHFKAVNAIMRVCAGNCGATASRGLVIQLKLTAPKVLPRHAAPRRTADANAGTDAFDYFVHLGFCWVCGRIGAIGGKNNKVKIMKYKYYELLIFKCPLYVYFCLFIVIVIVFFRFFPFFFHCLYLID